MATLSDDIPTTQPSTSLSRLYAANRNQSFFQQLTQNQLLNNVDLPFGSNSKSCRRKIPANSINNQFSISAATVGSANESMPIYTQS